MKEKYMAGRRISTQKNGVKKPGNTDSLIFVYMEGRKRIK
jgi:hypothetical protein